MIWRKDNYKREKRKRGQQLSGGVRLHFAGSEAARFGSIPRKGNVEEFL